MVNLSFIEKTLNVNAVHSGLPEGKKISGFIIDSRNVSSTLLAAYDCYIAIKGERYDGHDFVLDCFNKGVRYFIINKEYKNKFKKMLPQAVLFPVTDTVKALGMLAKKYKENLFSSILAITGSSGKTTTRELVVKILERKYKIHTAKKNFNNDIGLPLTLLETPPGTHITVVEFGMNHPGEIEKLSKIAEPLCVIITNIGYAHIGNLGSLNAIANAKAEVFSGINGHGYVFLNRDDDYFGYLSKISPVEVIDFGESDLKIIKDKVLDGYRLSYQGIEFDFNLPGSHNLLNLAAALKTGSFYHVDPYDMIDSVSSFIPVPGRSEIIKNNITIINDCYNANPSSMKAGLSLLSKSKGRRVAILADMLELGKLSTELHTMIGGFIGREHMADLVYAYGGESKALIESINTAGIDVRWFPSKEELTENILKAVKIGDTILVKASNGMKLETVVDALKEKF